MYDAILIAQAAYAVNYRPAGVLNGSKEFCQEFLTDVVVNDGDRFEDVDAG